MAISDKKAAAASTSTAVTAALEVVVVVAVVVAVAACKINSQPQCHRAKVFNGLRRFTRIKSLVPVVDPADAVVAVAVVAAAVVDTPLTEPLTEHVSSPELPPAQNLAWFSMTWPFGYFCSSLVKLVQIFLGRILTFTC